MIRSVLQCLSAFTLCCLAACAGGGMQDLQRTPKRDAVELSGRLLDTADYVASKFQEAYVAGFAAKIPGRQLAAIAVIRNEATANARALVLGPDPEGDLVDLYVWSRVALRSCENRSACIDEFKDFDCAHTHGAVAEHVRELAVAYLSPDRLARIDMAVDAFFGTHPDLLMAGLFRLDDLADQTGTRVEVFKAGGDDMFSSLNDTARQLQQTRLLGQQVLWLVSRTSTLVGWEAQTAIAIMMESDRVLSVDQSLSRIGPGLDSHAKGVEALANNVASQERELDALSKSLVQLGERIDGLATRVPEPVAVREVVRESILLAGFVLLALVGVAAACAWFVLRHRR
jgi:hypothetical protein